MITVLAETINGQTTLQEVHTGYEEVQGLVHLDSTELWVGSIIPYNPNKHDDQGLWIGSSRWTIGCLDQREFAW